MVKLNLLQSTIVSLAMSFFLFSCGGSTETSTADDATEEVVEEEAGLEIEKPQLT